ncbi:Ger(x)C family spore germination protein [Clostridium fungisolvens]|uniref:Ger(x)C family spore germination protein n=1 Tax=Clostridium fungisolvens TaxID=1604897 RepID=UPI001FCE65DD|nr:Ger(x)C family spore germination protein [Clostridium fungisolvens]
MKIRNMICLILIVIMLLNTTGCWDQKIYEESGFALQVGFEIADEDELLMCFTIPVLDERATEKTELIYGTANLLREFREEARKTSSKYIEGGKIQQVLISDSLAERGVHSLLEILEREPTDPTIAHVVVVEGSPKDLFEQAQTFGDKPPLPSIYLHQLIRSNIKSSNIPETRIFRFTTDYFAPGIDPITPIIKIERKKGKGIAIIGSALFLDDKMVGKIDTEQTALLLAMMGKAKKSVFISKNALNPKGENNKSGCAVNIKTVKRSLKARLIDDKPTIDISLNFKVILSEYKWLNKYDETAQKSIEDELAREIKEKCENTLQYTQEVGSDPLGIGDIIRSKYNNYWEKVKWEKEYKDVTFNVNVKVDINNYGLIR